MKKFKFGSVCSGIEAASCAWNPLGWEASFFSEIESFPCELLKHHYPETPNYGDMNNFKEWNYGTAIDVLVGGTPCQSFSVAGLRKGLDDPRGNLMLTFGSIAAKYRAQWLVWENVPGVLSSNGGRDFASFLGMLAELGYGFAYRVLDAQFFGVAQRRRRVFVVGYLGDWRPPAAVLFERHSLSGDITPSREKGEGVARNAETSIARMRGFGDYELDEKASALKSRDYKDATDLVCLQGSMIGRSDKAGPQGDGINKDVYFTLNTTDRHAVCIDRAAFNQGENALYDPRIEESETMSTLVARGPHAVAHTFKVRGGCEGGGKGYLGQDEAAFTLSTTHDQNLYTQSKVRRLTPKECERLQGFEDEYTKIPYRNKEADSCPDGPRYKALGNSMAVPVMRWIGERIQAVDDILESQKRESL